MEKLTDTYTLNNGVKIPVVGFGTWQSADGGEAYNSVKAALEAGYRHIDTAAAYGNEDSVGKAIKDSGIPRQDIFLTSKLWNVDHGYEEAKKALDASLDKLGVEYLDLYLIHWPNPVKFRDDWQKRNADSWRAMEEALDTGKVRAMVFLTFAKSIWMNCLRLLKSSQQSTKSSLTLVIWMKDWLNTTITTTSFQKLTAHLVLVRSSKSRNSRILLTSTTRVLLK